MSLIPVKLLRALAAMQVTHRRWWPRHLSFTEYVLSHRIVASRAPTYGSQEFNSSGQRRFPYRHPIIQEVINITWFEDKDDIGVIFYEYFAPIPFEVIALAVTVVRIENCALALELDGLYMLSDRMLHRRVVYWHTQTVQLEGRALQNQLLFASQLAS